MPVTPDELYAALHTLEIDYPLHRHPPLHTVAESRGLRGEIPGAHCKSLFSEEPQGSSASGGLAKNSSLIKQNKEEIPEASIRSRTESYSHPITGSGKDGEKAHLKINPANFC